MTDAGTKRACDSLEHSQYVGPAPLPIEKYNQMIMLQTARKLQVSPDSVKKALGHLVLTDGFHRRIGPAAC